MTRLADTFNDEPHSLSWQTVASGAGRGVCSCGWRSNVSDDGKMYEADYYSPRKVEIDHAAHVAAVNGGPSE